MVQGTPVTDSATLSGANAAIATGAVGYNVYSDPACTKLVTAAGAGALTGATAAASTAEALPAGIYYWQASYGGDPNNKAATSTCGSEILTVQAPTTTTTTQTGGGVVGPSIPVLKGSSVTDLAHIAGAQAATATGAVTYTLYKEAKCKAVLATSVATVTGGVAGPSVAIKPKVGTYYWVASYSGGGLDAPSASPCGSEKLVVSLKANLGLPNGKKCFSKRAFSDPPAVPEGREDRLLQGVHQRQAGQRRQALQTRPRRSASSASRRAPTKLSSSPSRPAAPATRTRARSTPACRKNTNTITEARGAPSSSPRPRRG